jgi:Sulfatase
MVLKKTSLTEVARNLLMLILFPSFFILHGYNENFGLISFVVLFHLFINYGIITVLVFITSLLLLKECQKAFVFSFFLLCIFFFFGFSYDTLKILFSNNFFSSYSFILSFILLLVLLLFFFIKKGIKNIFSVSKYIIVVLCVFIFIELVLYGYNLITNKTSKNNLCRYTVASAINKKKTCTAKDPDIFFIVFDEYMSSKGLSEYFNFNNRVIDSLFTSAGFYTSSGSKSNYNMTAFSLASTFNYNYLDLQKGDNTVSHNTFLKASTTFKENRLTSFLTRQGYDIINYGCFDLENAILHTKPYFESLSTDMIDNQTIISRIKKDIGWNFAIKNIFNGQFKIPKDYKRNKEYHLYRNNFNIEQTLKELTRPGNKPRFIYAHIMLPHDPYFFDSTGNFVSDTAILQGKINRGNAYISQLIYSNKLLSKIIQAALTKTNRERVVIIEGDHGFGFHDDTTFKDREFKNLNEYYFSDLDYHSLYSSVSPVNTFRIVLNKYFCYNLPLLKDSSIYLQQKKRF